jgi:16S rRNA (guanine(527)-N(7))-methyltransferase RsmG
MFREVLAREFAPYGALSPLQLDLLEAHYKLLTAWNQRINLIRVRSVEEAVQLHYCESLFLGTLLPDASLAVADIGSGGGFPGIPIAILRPEYRVALIEAHKRKSVFLREAARLIPNVRVLVSRAEEVGEQFDWMVSRAVRPEEVLQLKLGGRIALLVGEEDARRLGEPWRLVKSPWGRSRFVAIRCVEKASCFTWNVDISGSS